MTTAHYKGDVIASDGTSISSAIVAGAAAALLSVAPNLSTEKLRSILKQTTNDNQVVNLKQAVKQALREEGESSND